MDVEFYFDFSCPYAYIASTQIEKLVSQAGGNLLWKPMLLGGVFRAIGQLNVPRDGMPAAKAKNNLLDIAWSAEVAGLTINIPAEHPRRTVKALRCLLGAPPPRWSEIIHAFYRAYWVDGLDVAASEVCKAVLISAGLTPGEADAALVSSEDDEMRVLLRKHTDEALARGVFGIPTTFVGGYMFWGHDRLAFVDRVLKGWRPPTVMRVARGGTDGV